MIFVLATIQAVPGRRAELLQEFHQIVPTVRAEVGCIEYGPAVDVDSGIETQHCNADAFTVVEKWESLEALRDHLAAPHMASYREKVADLVDSVELKILEPA
jgi:quinol monooxygenase YgiN